jgi:HEAT repeat protein
MVRAYAALGLGVTPAAEDAPALIHALEKDPDAAVKACAAMALGRTATQEGNRALAQALSDAKYLQVSDFAAIGLGLSRRPDALAPLVGQLDSKQKDLACSCCIGLTLLEDPKSVPSLLKASRHRQYSDVREFALFALGRLRTAESFPRLLEGLDDAHPYVRESAALGLAMFRDPKACPSLGKARDREKLAATRNLIALAFDLLTDDVTLPLTAGKEHRGDPRNQTSRRADAQETRRLLNTLLPKDYKLPITP